MSDHVEKSGLCGNGNGLDYDLVCPALSSVPVVTLQMRESFVSMTRPINARNPC